MIPAPPDKWEWIKISNLHYQAFDKPDSETNEDQCWLLNVHLGSVIAWHIYVDTCQHVGDEGYLRIEQTITDYENWTPEQACDQAELIAKHLYALVKETEHAIQTRKEDHQTT